MDEIKTLEMKITDIQGVINHLKTELTTEQKTQIDFTRVEQSVVGNKLTGHRLTGNDREITYKYCVVLAMLAEQSGDIHIKVRQFYHVFRIYHTLEDDSISEALIRDARINDLELLVFLKENLSKELLIQLMVDALLIVSIGERKGKQLDLAVELFAFFGMKKGEINLIKAITKSILEMNDEQLLELAKETDINSYFSYMDVSPDYVVIGYFSNIFTHPANTIMVYGDTIKDINSILAIDTFGKKRIIFKKCTFENILGITALKTEVIFDECVVLNCVQNFKLDFLGGRNWGGIWGRNWGRRYENDKPTTYFLGANNMVIRNSQFKNCKLLGVGQRSNVFRLNNSTIQNVSFTDCSLAVSTHSRATGSVLNCKDSSILECEFNNCTVYGEGDYGSYDEFHMSIASSFGGRITDCTFIKCKADSQSVSDGRKDNYILISDARCVEKNNTFTDDYATQVWNYERSHANEVKTKREQGKDDIDDFSECVRYVHLD